MANKKNYLILAIFVSITILFFWKFFLRGFIPLPADIITGLYYPWLDYQWGNLVGVAVKNPLMSDIPSLIYPWRTLAVKLPQSGKWPLWNQYSFSGYPLLGNWQSAPFSPANIFYLLPSLPLGWSLGVIFQPLLAAWFMYLWLRHHQLRPLAAFLGGVLYAFCGFHFTWMDYNTHLWTTLWFPLILLSVDQLLAGNYAWTKWLAVFIALSILSGYPIILVYEFMVVSAYSLYRLLEKPSRKQRSLLKLALHLVFSLGLGLGLSAIQWLPGWQTIQQSIHAYDQSTLNSANQGFMPFMHWLTALAPDLFGNPATYNYWGIGYYDNWAFYISIGALLLAGYAFIRVKSARFWLLILLLGVTLSSANPLGNGLRQLIPLLNNSIPSRGLFLVDLGLAVAGAYGLQQILSQPKKSAIAVYLPLAVIGGLMALLWANVLIANFLHIPDLLDHQDVATRNLILPTLTYFICAGLLIFPQLLKINRITWWWALLVVVIIADLFRYGWKYLPFTPASYLYPPTEITNWLLAQKQTQEPFRVEFGKVIPPNLWIPYRLESPTGYDALQPLRSGQFLEAIQSGQLKTDSLSRFPEIQNLDSPLFPLTNTKYVLALKYTDKWERSLDGTQYQEIYDRPYLLPVYTHGTVTVFENQRFLPRAFVVPHAEIMADDQQLIAGLTDPQTDLLHTVYLENQDRQLPLITENQSLPNYQISWQQSEGQSRQLEVQTDQPGYLVILESYHPAWQALIDHRPASLNRADFNFMALPMLAGSHQVSLNFWPLSFQRGLWITCGSILFWLFWVVKSRLHGIKKT